MTSSKGALFAAHWPTQVSRVMFVLIVVVLSTSVSRDLSPRFPALSDDAFATVSRGNFELVLNQMGPVESSNNVVYVNQCEFPTRVLTVVEEGTWVEPGDIIMELDATSFKDSARQREILLVNAEKLLTDAREDLRIQELTNASKIAQAELAARIAELELRSYTEAKYPQSLHQLESAAVLAAEKLNSSERQLQFIADMVRLGYRNPSEREAQRLVVLKDRQAHELAQDKVRVLNEFTFTRTSVNLAGINEEAQQHVERTKAVARAAILRRQNTLRSREQSRDLNQSILDRTNHVIAACVIRATQAGEVVIGNTSASRSGERLQEGSSVYHLLTLAMIPDRRKMQVRIRVHESRIRLLEEGVTADIVVDAMPDMKLSGKVVSISRVPLSGQFPNYDLREYGVVVEVTSSPELTQRLSPGMTAQVALHTAQTPDAITVPLTSVVQIGAEHYAFVQQGERVEPKPVIIGLIGEQKVQIREGLAPGEKVVVQPRVTCADRLLWLESQQTL